MATTTKTKEADETKAADEVKADIEETKAEKPQLGYYNGRVALITGKNADGTVNVRVFKDSNDDFWVPNVSLGEGPGEFDSA